MARVCMLGLDCLSPELVFARYWDDLPNLRQLACDGVASPLRSCDPPITVPAWAVMMTGLDPGSLGVYGFHGRTDRSYHRRTLASSLSYHAPPLWTRLGAAGRVSRILALPQTYPPKPLNGYMVTGALTPTEIGWACYPDTVGAEVQAALGDATVDIADFRALPPAELVRRAERNTHALFGLLGQWAERDDWDFLMLVDMGADRLQHALWRFCVADHPRFTPGHPLQESLRSYYRLLDAWVGSVRARLRPDDLLLVVSDHGAQPLQGTVALNQWLLEHGYLRLLGPAPTTPTPFDPATVDWPHTRAWADGGYAGRIYLNVRDREPQGCVPRAGVPALLSELEERLQALMTPATTRSHRVMRPVDLFREVHAIAPDLMVYFGNLSLRALGTLGHAEVLCADNDHGPDGANHAQHGVLLMAGGDPAGHGPWDLPGGASIYDIAPTVLHYLGASVPPSMIGSVLTPTRQEPR